MVLKRLHEHCIETTAGISDGHAFFLVIIKNLCQNFGNFGDKFRKISQNLIKWGLLLEYRLC